MEVVSLVQTVYGTVTGAIEYINKIRDNYEQAQELYVCCTNLQPVLEQLRERVSEGSTLPATLQPSLQHIGIVLSKAQERTEKIYNSNIIKRSLLASYHAQKLQDSAQALQRGTNMLLPHIIDVLGKQNAKLDEVKDTVGDLQSDLRAGMLRLEQEVHHSEDAVSSKMQGIQHQIIAEIRYWMLKVVSQQESGSNLSPHALASELQSKIDQWLGAPAAVTSTAKPQRSDAARAKFTGVVEEVVRLLQGGEVQQAAKKCQQVLDAADDGATSHEKMKEALEVICEVCIDMEDDWEQLMKLYMDPFLLVKGAMIKGASQVYIAQDKSRGEEVALKVINLAGGTEPVKMAQRHLYVMLQAERLGLTNICSIYGCTLLPYTGGDDSSDDEAGEGDQRFGLVMKRYKRSLEEAVPAGGLPLEDALRYACGILKGLVGLHSVPIVMNDLKPRHVLLDEHDEAVLTDFGMARKLERYTVGYSTVSSIDGTTAYMAPEYFDYSPDGKTRLSPKSDVWGFAATAVYMLTGASPFPAKKNLKQVTHAIKTEKPRVPTSCPLWLQQLLRQCFALDSLKRPDARRALEIVAVHELISKLASNEVRVQQTAAAALGSSKQPELIAAAGGIEALVVQLLSSASADVQEAAAQALGKLSSSSNSIKQRVAAAGVIQALQMGMEVSESTRVRQAAREALSKLQ